MFDHLSKVTGEASEYIVNVVLDVSDKEFLSPLLPFFDSRHKDWEQRNYRRPRKKRRG